MHRYGPFNSIIGVPEFRVGNVPVVKGAPKILKRMCRIFLFWIDSFNVARSPIGPPVLSKIYRSIYRIP